MNQEFVYETCESLTPAKCQEIIRKFEEDARKTEQAVPEMKNVHELRISVLPEWKEIDDILFTALQKGFNEYVKHVYNESDRRISLTGGISDKGYTVEKYFASIGLHDWHHDFAVYTDDAGNTKECRMIGFKWFLSGEASGKCSFIGKTVQPQQGKLVFFPASWTAPYCMEAGSSESMYVISGHFACKNA